MSDLHERNKNSDPRQKATAAIWGCATGMFALCIPLVGLTRVAVVIPATIALGAGAGTVAVWRSERYSRSRPEGEQSVRSLEERVANLEAIVSHGEFDIQRQFEQLEFQKRTE